MFKFRMGLFDYTAKLGFFQCLPWLKRAISNIHVSPSTQQFIRCVYCLFHMFVMFILFEKRVTVSHKFIIFSDIIISIRQHSCVAIGPNANAATSLCAIAWFVTISL